MGLSSYERECFAAHVAAERERELELLAAHQARLDGCVFPAEYRGITITEKPLDPAFADRLYAALERLPERLGREEAARLRRNAAARERRVRARAV